MGLDDLLDQRQPQPCALDGAGFHTVYTVKLVKQLGHGLRRDSHPLVRHPHHHLCTLLACAHDHLTATRRKLHRIGEQVGKHLADPVRIGSDRRQGVECLKMQGVVPPFGGKHGHGLV